MHTTMISAWNGVVGPTMVFKSKKRHEANPIRVAKHKVIQVQASSKSRSTAQ
jgi:hypothetical protein